MEKKTAKQKHVQKSTCTFWLFLCFWSHVLIFFLIVLNEFRKWECLKNCSLNDDEVEEVKPALRNDVYNQHYFV